VVRSQLDTKITLPVSIVSVTCSASGWQAVYFSTTHATSICAERVSFTDNV
jgi:hypothetical protein